MGAAESVLLYDENAADMASIPQGPVRTRSVPKTTSVPIADNTKRLRKASSARMAPRTNPPSQQPRRRTNPAKSKPIKPMEGLVLGGPKTGKRTLLSRLKGVDPFAAEKEKGKNSVDGNNNNNDSKAMNGTKDQDEASTNPSIVIQYKPSPDYPTWDRIKLHVQYANSIESGEKIVQTGKTPSNIDFVVVLVSPNDSRETTMSYLESIMAAYLDRLGYRKEATVDADSDANIEESAKETVSEKHGTGVMEPFCIVILFNFRDLQEERIDENDPAAAAAASREDLERLVRETLQSRNVLENKFIVELLETSLLNCYGLDGLHRFIYRTYLQRSETDIEKHLYTVRSQIIQTNTVVSNQVDDDEAKAESTSYDAFLKKIAPKEETLNPVTRQEQMIEDLIAKYGHLEQHDQDKDQQPQNEEAQSSTEEPPAPRRIDPRQSRQQKLRIGKEALEAFLASSSDEEEAEKMLVTRRGRIPTKGRSGFASSTDDDSDDDFFYDEDGRHEHLSKNNSSRITSGQNALNNDSSDDDASSSDSDNEDEDVNFETIASEENKTDKVSSEDPKHTDEQLTTEEDCHEQAVVEEETTENDDEIQSAKNETIETEQHEDTTQTPIAEKEEEMTNEEDSDEAPLPSDETEKTDETEVNAQDAKAENDEYAVDERNANHGDCDDSDMQAGKIDEETDGAYVIDVTKTNCTDTVVVNEDDPNEVATPLNEEEKLDEGESEDDVDDSQVANDGEPPSLSKTNDEHTVDCDGGNDSNDGEASKIVDETDAVAGTDVTSPDGEDAISTNTNTHGDDNDETDNEDGVVPNDKTTYDNNNALVSSNVEDSEHEGDVLVGANPSLNYGEDDNGDDCVIYSTPTAGNAREFFFGNDEDEENDEHFKIGAWLANREDEDEDDDEDGFMIGAARTNNENDDNDDDDGGFMIGAVPSNTQDDDDDDDEEGFMIGAVPTTTEDDDDDGFAIGTKDNPTTSVAERPSPASLPVGGTEPVGTTTQGTTPATTPPPATAPTTSGISQAALAAIAAAQEEAEAMMHQQLQQQRSPPKEKKSKKKKKEEKNGEKKKKKKKKTKSLEA